MKLLRPMVNHAPAAEKAMKASSLLTMLKAAGISTGNLLLEAAAGGLTFTPGLRERSTQRVFKHSASTVTLASRLTAACVPT